MKKPSERMTELHQGLCVDWLRRMRAADPRRAPMHVPGDVQEILRLDAIVCYLDEQHEAAGKPSASEVIGTTEHGDKVYGT